MYNKKVLSTAVSKLGSAKAPTKKRDKVYTNKEALSPFVSSEGFKQGPPPAGTNYRIPGDTLYNPTPYSIEAVSDNGIRKTLNPNDTTNVQFPGATYVDEYQMGGEDYYEDELTDDEIEELRRGGYIVEDISIPSVGGYKKGGALLTKKVTCKNCGWSWDAADGGNDLTTCHKCGGKGLIHAQTGGPLPKAQLGKNKVTLEASPFSLNANQAQLASDVYGEYDPEFLIGASMPIGGSRDPRIANSLSLTAGLPLNGTAVPSINAGYKFRYRPSSMNAGAFAPTTQLDVGAGWDPTQGLNFQAKANPRWEFANRRADAYLKHNWPVGAWRGYAGPSGGLNLRQNSFVAGLAGYGTQEKTAGNINLFYGAEAGIEGRPFKKTPLRVGLDAGLLMNLAKKQAEESFNPETDFGKSATGFTPMLKAKVVYPLGTAYPKKKEASEEKVRLDAARANDKNYQVDAPTITGPGVDWDYENRPEQSGVPVGYLPGYEPETGRQLTEEELMQRYSPRLAKGGNLPIAQTGQQIYKYADRPEARYKKDDKGNWLINLPSTNGQFVPINDASGKRAGELNEKATLDPSQFRRQYEPMTDVKPQVVENTAIPNAPKADPTLIDRAVQQKQAERAIVGEKIRANPLLTEDQKLEIITSPQKLDENVHLAYEKGPDEVKAYTPDKPQDFWDKAGDVVSNPMTSLGFLMRGEAIPDYMQRDMDRGTFGYYSNGELHTERNPLDFAVADMTGLSLVNDARSTYKGLSEGDYTQAGLGLLSFIPGFGEARKAVNAIDATADANKAMRIAENTQDLSQKTSPLVREQIMREVPIEAPYFNRSAVNPNYAYPMTKGRTVSYDETIDLIEDMHNTYPTYQQSGYPIYFHGSTSASIPGIVNNEGILPLGELMNTGQVPFTGELAYGVNGINQGHTSTAFIRTPESALSYALNQSGKGRVDVEGELNRWFTERRPNFEQIPGMPKAEFYDDLYNKRLTQWNALTDQEKALLNENYPVLYGIKPKTGNVEGANRFRVPITDIADETAIAGKIGMDEIPSMFVPRTHVESLQKFLGDRTKVLPMDDFIKNQRIPYKAKQSADRWSELGYDLNYGLGGVATALNHFRKGGEKKYSRSLSAKNRLFVENKLTKKQKSKKKKIFDPKAKYFEDGGENQVEGIPNLPLNQNRQVLRDWVYGQSIGMLQEDDGGYMDLDLSDEEIEAYRQGGYYVEEY